MGSTKVVKKTLKCHSIYWLFNVLTLGQSLKKNSDPNIKVCGLPNSPHFCDCWTTLLFRACMFFSTIILLLDLKASICITGFFVRRQKNSAPKKLSFRKNWGHFYRKTQPTGGFDPSNETKLVKLRCFWHQTMGKNWVLVTFWETYGISKDNFQLIWWIQQNFE